jgi:hypothetical protein
MPPPKLYAFSTHIGAACARKMVTFFELAGRSSISWRKR